jgi:hypothetical protein
MTRYKYCYLIALLLLPASVVFGQGARIEIPPFNDRYTDYIKKLEGGNTEIDYVDFRHSFLESRQYSLKGRRYDSLKKLVMPAAESGNYQEVISLTKAMLSIDYTSMYAHKFLQQTYKILGDTVNRNKYHDIEFGLLNSIARNGNGKTCETGWHVIQIEEEYFMLDMLGAVLQRQSISSGGSNMCDKMEVMTEEGEQKTYYFEIGKVFEARKKLLKKK